MGASSVVWIYSLVIYFLNVLVGSDVVGSEHPVSTGETSCNKEREETHKKQYCTNRTTSTSVPEGLGAAVVRIMRKVNKLVEGHCLHEDVPAFVKVQLGSEEKDLEDLSPERE